MTSLKDKIVADMTTAMKEKNTIARDILRVIKGEIERSEQGPKGKVDLNDGDITKIIKKSIEGIKETTKDEEQIRILEAYLPKQLTEQEIRTEVQKFLREANSEMGPDGPKPFTMKDVMGHFNSNFNGRVDGRILSAIAKEELSK